MLSPFEKRVMYCMQECLSLAVWNQSKSTRRNCLAGRDVLMILAAGYHLLFLLWSASRQQDFTWPFFPHDFVSSLSERGTTCSLGVMLTQR